MRKRLGLLSMVLVLMLTIAPACGEKYKEVSLGVTKSGSYSNDYFGMSLNFPTNWINQDADKMNELMDQSMEYMENAISDNEDKERVFNLAKARTLNLLCVSKFPLDAGEIGPSVIAYAEKLSPEGINNGKGYLQVYKRQIEKTGFTYKFENIKTVYVGGKNMDMLKGSVDYGAAVKTTQEFYTRIMGEYAFCFVVTYIDDESKAETDKIMDSVSFK
jgi:hypothetical protein